MKNVSVVIPVKNGYPEIKDCIQGILQQSIFVQNIVIIDSGSTDGTLEYLKTIDKVHLIQIDANSFNHGSTRNLGWINNDVDYILYTVQDAKPANENWIEQLLNGFIDDEVVGVCGQQIVPWDKNKNPIEWHRPINTPKIRRVQYKELSSFNGLSVSDKKNACSWDNVTAIYKRSIFNDVIFPTTVFGEDMLWAKKVLQKGYALVYNYNAKVFHYHQENKSYTFKRTFTTLYFRYKEFGYRSELPNLNFISKLKMLRILYISLGLNFISIFKWYRYNISQFEANKLAILEFDKALNSGELILDKKHEQICSIPPTPLKQV